MIQFENLQISDLLRLDKKDVRFYYFIYDRTPEIVYYTVYKFKDSKVVVKKEQANLKNYCHKIILKAQNYAHRGELVRSLLDVEKIK